MASPTDAELLRFIARQEPLARTREAFPALPPERLRERLEALAERLEPAAPQMDVEAPPPPPTPSGLRKLRVYTDGAARGNPGPAGAGAVLLDPSGEVVARVGKYLGTQTNN